MHNITHLQLNMNLPMNGSFAFERNCSEREFWRLRNSFDTTACIIVIDMHGKISKYSHESHHHKGTSTLRPKVAVWLCISRGWMTAHESEDKCVKIMLIVLKHFINWMHNHCVCTELGIKDILKYLLGNQPRVLNQQLMDNDWQQAQSQINFAMSHLEIFCLEEE